MKAGSLSADHKIFLKGLGGTNTEIIGALAAIGLDASGDGGRYIQVGSIRELTGLTEISWHLSAKIHAVKTLAGAQASEWSVNTEKLRPSHREGKVVLYVENLETIGTY